MGAQLRNLPLLLLLLLTFQEMMASEAAICGAPSKYFNGLCFSSNNCSAICDQEGFLFGECNKFKCICKKDCGGGSPPAGGDGDEPGEGPPDGGEESGDEPSEDGGDEEPSFLGRKSLIKS